MILTALLATAALYGGQTPVLTSAGTSQATAEGVEILRRLLVESLDKAFEVEPKADRLALRERHVQGPGMGLVTTLWAGQETVDHARAFHMPAVGLFFALDLSLPVVVTEEKPTPGAGAGPGASGDEWERIRRELRGNVEGGGTFTFQRLRVGEPGGTAEIDPQAIEKTIDLALRTLARHAGRIEGLGTGDTATLALRLSGKSRTLLQDFAPEELDLYAESPEKAPASGAQPGMFSAYVLATGHDVREQHLVIRVPLANLGALAENREGLRQRAEINLY